MTLRRRVLLATVTVAVIAATVTALVTLQLVRSADNAAARDQLATQVERLARAAPATRAAIVESLSELDDSDVLVGLVTGSGVTSGSAIDLLPARVTLQLAAGREVSTTVRSHGETYLVEGRPAGGGGSVVAVQSSARVLGIGAALLPRLLLALGIGLAAALIAATLLSRVLARPLTRLAGAARRMTSGERGVPLEPSNVAEIADVESALTALDAALARSEGRQREFLLSISHEIRTPLTAIRGYGEALSDGMVPPDEVRAVGDTLVAESGRLTAFTSDLLALARLESDDFALDIEDVDVRHVLSSAATGWAAVAAGADVSLDVDVPDLPVIARADAARLRQVVDGLLENALRVSPAGTRILLGAASDAARPEIVIRDDGPGFTPDEAAHAFERGYLHDRYVATRPVGTGLGLSIASRLVERMGGSITAHSVNGGGAEFRIRLPR